jgi:hypothetical protein
MLRGGFIVCSRLYLATRPVMGAALTAALAAAMLLGGSAAAIPVSVSHLDLPTCDFLAVPPHVDELGDVTGGFPPDETITAVDFTTTIPACPASDTGAVNARVIMTNLTPFDFVEVWYVSDPETSLSNVDGLVNGEEAFRIDMVGLNRPLIFESGVIPGVFESGEAWEFIIDDYFNALGIGADHFFSPGAVGAASPGLPSSGSIIALIPEPSTGLLVGLGVLGIAMRRRRARAA